MSLIPKLSQMYIQIDRRFRQLRWPLQRTRWEVNKYKLWTMYTLGIKNSQICFKIFKFVDVGLWRRGCQGQEQLVRYRRKLAELQTRSLQNQSWKSFRVVSTCVKAFTFLISYFKVLWEKKNTRSLARHHLYKHVHHHNFFIFCFVFVSFCLILRWGLNMQPWLPWNFLYRAGWPQT